jgi:hypothetical protein
MPRIAAPVLARAHTRLGRILVAVALAGGAAIASAPGAAADTAPTLKSPFTCGQVWFARTYRGHARFAVDWNLPGSGEADFGQPVLAGGTGVANVKQHAGYGNMVVVDHGGGWATLYAHLSEVHVTAGQPVAADTVIGRVGRTGRADGSHLHQERLLNGVRQPIALDGVPIVASLSSRGTSYQSANCAPASPPSGWGRCRSRAGRPWAFGCARIGNRPLP